MRDLAQYLTEATMWYGDDDDEDYGGQHATSPSVPGQRLLKTLTRIWDYMTRTERNVPVVSWSGSPVGAGRYLISGVRPGSIPPPLCATISIDVIQGNTFIIYSAGQDVSQTALSFGLRRALKEIYPGGHPWLRISYVDWKRNKHARRSMGEGMWDTEEEDEDYGNVWGRKYLAGLSPAEATRKLRDLAHALIGSAPKAVSVRALVGDDKPGVPTVHYKTKYVMASGYTKATADVLVTAGGLRLATVEFSILKNGSIEAEVSVQSPPPGARRKTHDIMRERQILGKVLRDKLTKLVPNMMVSYSIAGSVHEGMWDATEEDEDYGNVFASRDPTELGAAVETHVRKEWAKINDPKFPDLVWSGRLWSTGYLYNILGFPKPPKSTPGGYVTLTEPIANIKVTVPRSTSQSPHAKVSVRPDYPESGRILPTLIDIVEEVVPGWIVSAKTWMGGR